jgi:hypothetical protein
MEDFEKEILDEACSHLKSNYKKMFKPTSNCRAPHIHIDSLRDHLFQFGVVRAHKFESSDDLYTFLINANNSLSTIKLERWMAMKGRKTEKTILKSLEKSKKNKFWLGMPGALGIVLGGGK